MAVGSTPLLYQWVTDAVGTDGSGQSQGELRKADGAGGQLGAKV